jgi:hypothetical protein
VSIRGNGNVSSITDNGTGNYTVNFTTAMADTNYSYHGSCQGSTGDGYVIGLNGVTPTQTTTAMRIWTKTPGLGIADSANVSVAFFR